MNRIGVSRITALPAGLGRFPRNLGMLPRSNFSTSAFPQNAQSQTTPPPPPPSKHKLFYREIWPPLLKCFAYGSISYFALHLTWQVLDSQEQQYLRDLERQELEGAVRTARQGS